MTGYWRSFTLLILLSVSACQTAPAPQFNQTIELYEKFSDLQEILDKERDEVLVVNFLILLPTVIAAAFFLFHEKVTKERALMLSSVSQGVQPTGDGNPAGLPYPVEKWVRNSGIANSLWLMSVKRIPAEL